MPRWRRWPVLGLGLALACSADETPTTPSIHGGQLDYDWFRGRPSSPHMSPGWKAYEP
jgi:hypothetical protein